MSTVGAAAGPAAQARAGFWSYLVGAAAYPRTTFARLADDPRQTVYGAQAVLLIGGLYTLTVWGLALLGAPISTPAWLAIPPERYYFWETFFTLPVFAGAWVLGSGVAHLLARSLGGSGSFEATAAGLAFAMTVPTFLMWVPDTISVALLLAGLVDIADWLAAREQGLQGLFWATYIYVAVAWNLALAVVAVAAAHRLTWWRAATPGILGMLAALLASFVFIR